MRAYESSKKAQKIMGILDEEHNLDEKPSKHRSQQNTSPLCSEMGRKFCFVKPTLCSVKSLAKGFMYRKRV
jgi:hypothetical protein